MDIFNQIFRSVFYENQNHKKNDETRQDEGVALEMTEGEEEDDVQNAQEFVQETLDYFKEALGGRPLKYIDDLKTGLGRTGDGVNSEIMWWAPTDHPIGCMLFKNPFQTPCRYVIDAKQYGKVAIYNNTSICLGVSEVAQLLQIYRGIELLESDQEKAASIITSSQPNPLVSIKKED